MAAPEDDDDARLAAIVASGRATRRPVSRAMWIAAGVVGALCAAGFVLLVLGGGGERVPEAAQGARGGCAGGLGAGIGIGLAIGFFLGRRQRAGHSSRSSP